MLFFEASFTKLQVPIIFKLILLDYIFIMNFIGLDKPAKCNIYFGLYNLIFFFIDFFR